MEKGAFFLSLFHLADLSPWQPKKFSIFGNEQKKEKNEQKKKKLFSTSFLFFFFLFLSFSTHTGLVSSVMIMLAAVINGDAKKLAELIRQDPGFNVNMAVDGYGNTLLHEACYENHRSAVIPLLLAHPDIDVNVKTRFGRTPFFCACFGHPSCVREMLKDAGVKVNEPNNNGWTPLWSAARRGHLDIIKWWIASGREMNLGKPGDVEKTDAIGGAKNEGETEIATLLERFKSDASKTRSEVRKELGING